MMFRDGWELGAEPKCVYEELKSREKTVASDFGSQNPYSPPTTPQLIAEVEEIKQPRKPLGHWIAAAIAWLTILAIVAFHIAFPYLFPEKGGEAATKSGLVIIELQAKYLLGAEQSGLAGGIDIEQQIGPFNTGALENRYCYLIMVNELLSANKALERLAELQSLIDETGFTPSEDQKAIGLTLQKLFQDYQNEAWEGPSVSAAEREQLVSRLNWFGTLALYAENSPDQQTRREITDRAEAVMYLLLGLFVLILMVGGIGFVGFLTFIVLICMGMLRFRTENYCGHGRIYLETFAIWMLLFLGIQIGVSLLGSYLKISREYLLLGLLAGSFASLFSLGWPLLRGVKFAEMLTDTGLRCKNVFIEFLWGLVGYVCSLPIMVGGFIITAILMALFGPGTDARDLTSEPASHPAMEWLSEAGVLGFIVIGLLTVASAPIVEETVFRGLLYRHLRDASSRWGRILSVLTAAFLNGLVFAAIHPQGLFAIPVLGALAFSFSLVREWRGCLFAPMTMHGLHNGMITVCWVLLFMN